MQSFTPSQATRDLITELTELYPESEIRNFSKLIFENLCGYSKTEWFTHQNTTLTEEIKSRFLQIASQLKSGKPLQYILGQAWFMDMPFKVSPSVLIPRPETEELVEWILSENQNSNPSILDIGTGSGCIAISLKKVLPQATVQGWDVSSDALQTAQDNSIDLNCNVNFKQVNILTFNAEETDMFDIIVSNPPYVRELEKSAMHLNVLDHEPHLALFVPDNDALIFYRTIAGLATKMLKKGGCLYFEINENLSTEMTQMLTQQGFTNIELRKDLNGKDRMMKATPK
jgi:release factor glutamine methyltransferase